MRTQNPKNSAENLREAEELRRQKIVDAANAAYARMKRDPKVWNQELRERALWDCTLLDGLTNESSREKLNVRSAKKKRNPKR
jgi:hypothetical protein